jgi:hypothetical protein
VGSFAPKGHAKVDPRSPQAFGICDCCGFQYLRRELYAQMKWMGNQLRWTGHLHCSTCWDVPNPTVRPIRLPADPPPVLNPRPEKHGPDKTTPEYKPPLIP